MNNVVIYGLLNEDRKIFWVSDFWIDEDDEMTALDDAFWKWMMAKDSEHLKWMEDLDEEKDIVILEVISKDKWSIDKLMKWIDVFKVHNYIIYSHEEVISFKYKQEREWDLEDRLINGEME